MAKPGIRFVRLLVAVGALLVPATAHAATTVSSNWAGYVVNPKAAATRFKKVSGTWVVPKGRCRAGREGFAATWVGIGGYQRNSRALEQTGTELACSASGSARYAAWFELVPDVAHELTITVRPGDRIDAAVTVKGTRVTIYLRNRTRGMAFRHTFGMRAPDTSSSAEWIVEAPADCNSARQCVVLLLGDFGTISFSRASATTARGTRGGISSSRWSNTEVTLSQVRGAPSFAEFVSRRGADPSAVSTDGTAFSVSYAERAPSTGAQPPMLLPASAAAGSSG
jgi:Peptidase A4 family